MPTRNWIKKRRNDIAKLKWPTSRRSWIARWQRNLDKIKYKAADLWADRKVYQEYSDIISRNPKIDKRAEFFHLVARMYVGHALLAIRRFDDTDLRSNSFYNLIEEIANQSNLLDKNWFVSRFPNLAVGEHQFQKLWGGKQHVSKKVIQSDLKSLVKLCKKVRRIANKFIAHESRCKGSGSITFTEINETIDGLYKLVSRYHALIFNADYGIPSIIPSGYVFTIPWAEKPIRNTTGI